MMNNSAEKIGNNLDILTEILLRLPTKSLLKFKCVAKQWLSLISNPHFCLCHTRQHQHSDFLEPTALLLAVEEHSTSPEFDIVPLKQDSGPFVDSVSFDFINSTQINLLQSCNGLFLCECFDYDNDDSVSRYFLCNPTTKKFNMLSIRKDIWDVFVSLAYDPLKSPHYKVISIRETSQNSCQFEIDIYSSETGSWAESKLSFEVEVGEKIIDFKNAVFCNGMIHWNSYSNESLCFDVIEECLLEMPMPTRRNDVLEIKRYFGESRGTLYLAVVYHHYFCLDLDVYEMERDYSHWFHKHHLNLADAMSVFPQLNLGSHPFCRGFSGVCFLRSETENQPKIVVWADGKIICYDFNDGAWKMVYDAGHGVKIGSDCLEDDIYHGERFLAYNYYENLSCI